MGVVAPLRILLASPRGFCAGVDRAIEIVERAIERFGEPVYVRHEIVHNRHVVDELRAKGAVFVDEPANSFGALSLDPPLVLWCLAKSAPSVPAFESSTYFAINVLGAGQRELSHRFATPAEDKFAGVAWSEGLGGAPLFDGCLARFECRHERSFDGGDHLIFVGMVERFAHGDGEPLLFVAGRYGAATGHPDDRGEVVASDDFADLFE